MGGRQPQLTYDGLKTCANIFFNMMELTNTKFEKREGKRYFVHGVNEFYTECKFLLEGPDRYDNIVNFTDLHQEVMLPYMETMGPRLIADAHIADRERVENNVKEVLRNLRLVNFYFYPEKKNGIKVKRTNS